MQAGESVHLLLHLAITSRWCIFLQQISYSALGAMSTSQGVATTSYPTHDTLIAKQAKQRRKDPDTSACLELPPKNAEECIEALASVSPDCSAVSVSVFSSVSAMVYSSVSASFYSVVASLSSEIERIQPTEAPSTATGPSSATASQISDSTPSASGTGDVNTNRDGDQNSQASLSHGEVAVITITSLALVLALCCLAFFTLRHRTRARAMPKPLDQSVHDDDKLARESPSEDGKETNLHIELSTRERSELRGDPRSPVEAP
ncbi:hypothetical protein F4780DRAFT_3094 [Xylariomycetidae sp. FL0641]|nr:hypothetical protein F4780DRAFT_3094 [Xylariomycetidae sp. FL0641]